MYGDWWKGWGSFQCEHSYMDTIKNVVCNADIWKNTKILFFK